MEIDMSGIHSPEELEDSAPIEEGFYKATVVSQYQDAKSGALKIVWRIESPPWSGASLTETHNLPGFCQKADALPGLIRKLGLFLYRMGLISKEHMGKRLEFDPAKLVGISRVLQIERKVGRDKPADSRKYSNVVYGCYYTEDRPEIPGHERARIGLPLLPGQTADKPAPAATTPAKTGSQPAATAAPGVQPSPAFDAAEVV
jgi:hypothetical protein